MGRLRARRHYRAGHRARPARPRAGAPTGTVAAGVRCCGQRAARRRSAPPKLVALSNALLAVADPRGSPDRTVEPARYGAWVENACLAHAWNSGQQVSYWREEPFEVDAIVEGGWGRWAIEVKTGTIAPPDLRGIAEFTRHHPQYRPLVLCDAATQSAVERAGLPAMPWREYLLGAPR